MENVHHGNAKLCGIMSARRTMCLSLAHLSGFSQLSMNRNAQRFKNLISEWKKNTAATATATASAHYFTNYVWFCAWIYSAISTNERIYFLMFPLKFDSSHRFFPPMHLYRKFQISDFTVLIYYFKWYEKHCHMTLKTRNSDEPKTTTRT